MYNKDFEIERKLEFFENKLVEIQEDFVNNLKPKLINYELKKLTLSLLENIQEEVNYFLKKNQLNISLNVSIYNDNNICIFGKTLIDNIVWNKIQQI